MQVTKGSTEARLDHVNDALEKGRLNTVDLADYDRSQIVGRASNCSRAKICGRELPAYLLCGGHGEDAKTGHTATWG